jgi:hypothetical protein
MAAIGREGGHSRGARAREAAGISGSSVSANTDIAQGTSTQPFVRQANEERSAFEPNRNAQPSSNDRNSLGSRSEQRGDRDDDRL